MYGSASELNIPSRTRRNPRKRATSRKIPRDFKPPWNAISSEFLFSRFFPPVVVSIRQKPKRNASSSLKEASGILQEVIGVVLQKIIHSLARKQGSSGSLFGLWILSSLHSDGTRERSQDGTTYLVSVQEKGKARPRKAASESLCCVSAGLFYDLASP